MLLLRNSCLCIPRSEVAVGLSCAGFLRRTLPLAMGAALLAGCAGSRAGSERSLSVSGMVVGGQQVVTG